MRDTRLAVICLIGKSVLCSALFCSMTLAEVTVQADATAVNNADEAQSAKIAPAVRDSPSFVDTPHRYLTHSFDGVARWFDNFFGDESADRRAAYSIVRLTHQTTFSEGGEQNDKLRLRGKLQLPNLKERVNIIFSDEDDDIPSAESQIDQDRNQQTLSLIHI